MTSFINYTVEANMALLLLLVLYKVLLQGETDFTAIRYVLLTGIFASLVFPLWHIQLFNRETQNIPGWSTAHWLPEFVIENFSPNEYTTFRLWMYANWLYIAGVGAFTIHFLFQFTRLVAIFKKANVLTSGRFKIAEVGDSVHTFSFFHYIFIGLANKLTEQEKQQIIQHEIAHARALHSLDILIINFIIIIFWFNPLIRIFRKIFVQLHEFEADARSAKFYDVDKYCNLLAKVALGSAGLSLANHFNQSLTVKRIQMMRTFKNDIKQWKLAAIAAALPVAFLILACHDQVVAQAKTPSSDEIAKSNEVYSEVDQLPEFQNGFDGLVTFLNSNLKYPSEAREKKIEGTVYAQFTVEKDGTLNDVNIIRGVAGSVDQETLRVIKSMPKWIPGKDKGKIVRTKMVLPVKFKL